MPAEARAPVPGATPEERRFISALESWRRELGLRHAPFAAAELGIERTIWYLMRRGDRGVSKAVLRRVLARRPDLWAHLNPNEPAPPAEPPARQPVDAPALPADEPSRAAFANYVLGRAHAEDAQQVTLADVDRWWAVWDAAWRAALDTR